MDETAKYKLLAAAFELGRFSMPQLSKSTGVVRKTVESWVRRSLKDDFIERLDETELTGGVGRRRNIYRVKADRAGDIETMLEGLWRTVSRSLQQEAGGQRVIDGFPEQRLILAARDDLLDAELATEAEERVAILRRVRQKIATQRQINTDYLFSGVFVPSEITKEMSAIEDRVRELMWPVTCGVMDLQKMATDWRVADFSVWLRVNLSKVRPSAQYGIRSFEFTPLSFKVDFYIGQNLGVFLQRAFSFLSEDLRHYVICAALSLLGELYQLERRVLGPGAAHAPADAAFLKSGARQILNDMITSFGEPAVGAALKDTQCDRSYWEGGSRPEFFGRLICGLINNQVMVASEPVYTWACVLRAHGGEVIYDAELADIVNRRDTDALGRAVLSATNEASDGPDSSEQAADMSRFFNALAIVNGAIEGAQGVRAGGGAS